MTWAPNYSGAHPSGGGQSEYFREVYGDATIGWVPPVVNYNFPDNISRRGPENSIFTWEEVPIELEDVMSGALLEFIMPDSYVIQITPDLGWQDTISMFGDDNDAGSINPHLRSLGPYSIAGGEATDNGNGSITVDITASGFTSAATKGFKDHLWRAIPFADGNPGQGGFPSRFEYISDESQLDFSIDEIIKETRRPIQTITGNKSVRTTITIENENNPTVFVEQSGTSWKIWFSIDREKVSFKIVATDSGAGIVGYHKVDITYTSFSQHDSHVWNSFDGFGLLASVIRLPGETNISLKERIQDSFSKRGGTHFQGLIYGLNRELGLNRIDDALTIERYLSPFGIANESEIEINVTHTRLSIIAQSLVKSDECILVDQYDNILKTSLRINNVIHIKTDKDTIIPESQWSFIEHESGRLIKMSKPGLYKITYNYSKDFDYKTYPNLVSLLSALNTSKTPGGLNLVIASTAKEISGSETSDKLYLGRYLLSSDNTSVDIGWSYASVKSVANEEWKRSFEDNKGIYFNSKFYRYAKELKSQTNVEWGFIVADENVWDAVGDNYGNSHLPLVYDTDIADYRLPVKIFNKITFDPWEAFRMNFYYGGNLIRNVGMEKRLFQSGVGFTKDCVVSLKLENLSAKDVTINLNPHVSDIKDVVDLDNNLINTILLDI